MLFLLKSSLSNNEVLLNNSIYATTAHSTHSEVTWPIPSTKVTVGGEKRANAFYGNAESKYKLICGASTYFHDTPFIANNDSSETLLV